METNEKIKTRISASGDEVDISTEAYAIISKSQNIREPLNQSQEEIKTLIDEIYFWRGKFSYMIGENDGLRFCLGLPQRSVGKSISIKEQSTNLRVVHKLQQSAV